MEAALAFSPYWVLKALSMTQNPFCPPYTISHCLRILDVTLIVGVNNAPLNYTHRNLHFSCSHSCIDVNQKYADRLPFCKPDKKCGVYTMRIFLGAAGTYSRTTKVRRHGAISWSIRKFHCIYHANIFGSSWMLDQGCHKYADTLLFSDTSQKLNAYTMRVFLG